MYLYLGAVPPGADCQPFEFLNRFRDCEHASWLAPHSDITGKQNTATKARKRIKEREGGESDKSTSGGGEAGKGCMSKIAQLLVGTTARLQMHFSMKRRLVNFTGSRSAGQEADPHTLEMQEPYNDLTEDRWVLWPEEAQRQDVRPLEHSIANIVCSSAFAKELSARLITVYHVTGNPKVK